MPGIPERVPRTPDVLRPSAGHRRGMRPALLPQALMRQHKSGEGDHHPDPRVVPAWPRRAAAGAPAQWGTQPAQGAIPARHAGGLARGPQPPRGPLRGEAPGTAVDHARDDPPELAPAVTHLDDLAGAQVLRGDQAGLGGGPRRPRRRRYTRPRTCNRAAGSAFPPSRRHTGKPSRRAPTCAISRAALSGVRSPQCTHSRHNRPIARAGCRHPTRRRRRVGCLSSRGTPSTRSPCVTCA